MADLSTGSPLASMLTGINQGANQGIDMAGKIEALQTLPLQRQALQQRLDTGALDLEAKKREEAILLAPKDYRKEPLYQSASPEHKATLDAVMSQIPENIRHTNLGFRMGTEQIAQSTKAFDALRDTKSRMMLGTISKARADYSAALNDPKTPPEVLQAKKTALADLQASYSDTQGKFEHGMGIVAVKELMRDPTMAPYFSKYPTLGIAARLVEGGFMDGKELARIIVATKQDSRRFSAIEAYIKANAPDGDITKLTPEQFNKLYAEANKLSHPTAGDDKGFSLSPGQTRYDASGRPIVHMEDREAKAKELQQFLVDFDVAQKDKRLNENTIETYRPLAKRFGYDIQLKQVPGSVYGTNPLYVLVPKEGVVGGAVKDSNAGQAAPSGYKTTTGEKQPVVLGQKASDNRNKRLINDDTGDEWKSDGENWVLDKMGNKPLMRK